MSAAPTAILRIGTRGSKLAMWQAHHVAQLLRAQWGQDLGVDIVEIATQGDLDKQSPLHTMGGKGVFVRAIEARLLAGEVDIAVHSMKDLPSQLPEGLEVACTPERADPRDALVCLTEEATLAKLPAGTRLGTGSLRRGALARRLNAGLEIVPIRGNVPTRLKKLDTGEVDAVLLAAAGLDRLGFGDRITQRLDPERFCPSAGQGILALQTRVGDQATRAMLSPIRNVDAQVEATLERAFLGHLGAGCNVPLGCHAKLLASDVVTASAVIIDPSGRPCFMASRVGHPSEAADIGVRLAETLLRLGAGAVLEADAAA